MNSENSVKQLSFPVVLKAITESTSYTTNPL
nr:MAG TPA: hypothetical protein [Caudoviricetes sp.]